MAGSPVPPFGLIEQAWHVAATHGDWMGWNLLLALIPLSFAAALFRAGTRRGGLWWAGLVVFVLFLPNAPYVLTDVVHLFDDIRGTPDDLRVLLVHLPIYLAFFAVGFGSYVASLELARRAARAEAPGLSWWPVESALHLLCAAGIYLGRVVRLNSWNVLTRPRAVVAGMGWLAGIEPLALVAITAVVLAALTLVVRALTWSAADALGRARVRLRPAS